MKKPALVPHARAAHSPSRFALSLTAAAALAALSTTALAQLPREMRSWKRWSSPVSGHR
jgi:hypothetical protein